MNKTPCQRLVLSGLTILMISCCGKVPDRQGSAAFTEDLGTTVIAHRGGSRLRPENTMPAFKHALELGVQGLELDVHMSRDGELVVIHDFTVERTTRGRGRVAEMDLKELKSLDAGYSFTCPDRPGEYPWRGRGLEIPALREVLQEFPRTLLCIEIKPDQPEIAGILAEMLLEFERLDRTVVSSFHRGVLDRLRRELPRAVTGASKSEVRWFYILHRLHLAWLYSPEFQVLQIPERSGPFELATPEFMRRARNKGLLVQVWTVNREEDMARYLEMGVDGIITDRPDLLLQMIGDRGG
ncbi:MAG: glycerophosphodiester phosphodiesterase [Thermodesulfobacteriota bacterium]